MMSTTRYFAEGSLIADSREIATGLMVITSGSVGVELPMDSNEADEENSKPEGTTLLCILGVGELQFQKIVFRKLSENLASFSIFSLEKPIHVHSSKVHRSARA